MFDSCVQQYYKLHMMYRVCTMYVYRDINGKYLFASSLFHGTVNEATDKSRSKSGYFLIIFGKQTGLGSNLHGLGVSVGLILKKILK